MTDDTAAAERLLEIFHPYAAQPMKDVRSGKARFAHYTTAEGALGILRSQSFWMRKVSCMADFMEVNHGSACLKEAYDSSTGERLKKTMNALFPGFTTQFEAAFNDWWPHFRTNTYIGSVSQHHSDEDRHGRLSMWRAFGPGAASVALVFNGEPFGRDTTNLAVYSSPITYLRNEDFPSAFERLVVGIEANADYLRSKGAESVHTWLFHAFRLACLCVKHRGFEEEREWRIFYSPLFEESKYVSRSIEVVRGIPQPVCALRLQNDPANGITGIEMSELFDRLIIGPTQYGEAVFEAFCEVLGKLGIAEPHKKVYVSDIPIRTQG